MPLIATVPLTVLIARARAEKWPNYRISARVKENSFWPRLVNPPPPGRGVKTLPCSKGKKESPGESPGVSEGPGRPPKKSQKRVSWRLCESKITFFDSEDSFLTLFGRSARTLGDSPGDSPGDSFLTFWAGEGFDSSPKRGGSQTQAQKVKSADLGLVVEKWSWDSIVVSASNGAPASENTQVLTADLGRLKPSGQMQYSKEVGALLRALIPSTLNAKTDTNTDRPIKLTLESDTNERCPAFPDAAFFNFRGPIRAIGRCLSPPWSRCSPELTATMCYWLLWTAVLLTAMNCY